jgi:hypothetical protein
MAIRSIKDLPRGKRATNKQIESAKKAKPIERKGKSVGRTKGRLEYGFGTIKKEEAPGIIKGFRRKFKADFGAIIKDVDGNIIARTHVAKGTSTLPEQMIVKALSKYGKSYDEIQLVLVIPDKKKKGAVKKSKPKKSTKKISKKSMKKKVGKTLKKVGKIGTTKTKAKKIAKKTVKRGRKK